MTIGVAPTVTERKRHKDAGTADLGGDATLGRTSSALTDQGDLRAASIVGLRPTLPMTARLLSAC